MMSTRKIAAKMATVSMFLISCNSQSGSPDTTDSLSQPIENNGVPLNNLELSRDTDSVDQQIENNSGVPLDNLNRDGRDDTVSRPNLN